MPSKMSSIAVLGAAAYGTYASYTAFTVGSATAGQVAERSLRLGQQQPADTYQIPSMAGVCALGVVAAGVGAASSKRSVKRSKALARAADKNLTDRLQGVGPEAIQVMKDICTFDILITALKTAGLIDALAGPGPFTLFAPDDKAFGEFLKANNLTAEQLLASPDLANILKHHVFSGSMLQKDFKNMEVPMLDGTPATLKKGAKGVLMAGAMIKKPDIEASNGVIHIINNVMKK